MECRRNSKRSKKKCNELRPTCSRCETRTLDCQYRSSRTFVENGLDSAPQETTTPSNPQSAPSLVQPILESAYTEVSVSEQDSIVSPHNSAVQSQALKNLDFLVETHSDLVEFRKCLSQVSGVSDNIPDPVESYFSPTAFDGVFTAHLSSNQDFAVSDLPATEHDSPEAAAYPTSSPYTATRFTETQTQHRLPQAYHSRHWKRLFNHFRHEFCHVIIYNEKRPSSFDLHFASLAHFEPLLDAILAVGAAHLGAVNDQASTDAQSLRNESIELHSKALRGLHDSIRRVGIVSDGSRNAVVACTFCLIFYEMVVAGVSTATTQHLLGALHLLKTDERAGSNMTSMFHHKLFRYFDVINALVSGRPPLTGSLTYDDCFAEAQDIKPNKWGADPYSCVDDVFGLAKDLWPLLHRLAQLSKASCDHTWSWLDTSLQTVAEESDNPREFSGSLLTDKHRIASCATLELAIRHWKPQLLLHAINMEHASSDLRLRALIHCAEAYRYSALTHLFTIIYGDTPDTNRVQVTSRATLQACLRVITFGPPFRGLLWPTIVAGSQATTSADREIVLTILRQMYNVQGMTQISKIESLIEKWWSIFDKGEKLGTKWLENMCVTSWPVPLA